MQGSPPSPPRVRSLIFMYGHLCSPYEVLGVDINASVAQIKQAYRRRVLQCHPDKPGGGAEAFRAVYEAFATLGGASTPGNTRTEMNWADLFSDIARDTMTAEQALRKACVSGDVAEVERLLKEGTVADLDAKDDFGVTALKYACMAGREACAALLLNHSADVNHVNSAGVSALHEASRTGQLNAVQLLLERGAAVNHVNRTGHTALMFACIQGSQDCAEHLCANGAHRATCTYEQGLTAADYARRLRHPRLAAWLDGTLEALSLSAEDAAAGRARVLATAPSAPPNHS